MDTTQHIKDVRTVGKEKGLKREAKKRERDGRIAIRGDQRKRTSLRKKC